MARIAKKVLIEDGVRFDFSNGTSIDALLTGIPFEIKERLAIHGLSQKLGDSYASAGDKGWSVQDCADTMAEVLRNLQDGVWSAAGGSGVNILAEALARLSGKTVEEAVEVIGRMTDDQVKVIAKRPDVKAEVAKIKAERAEARAKTAPESADFDDLLDMFR